MELNLGVRKRVWYPTRMNTTRRAFVGLMAASSSAAAEPRFTEPIGLNLFTVRGPLSSAPAQTYAALGRIGIVPLELRPPNLAPEHAAMIRDAGMKPAHLFIESAIITGAWDEWREFSRAMASRFRMPSPPANAPRPRLEDMIELARRHRIQRLGISMLLAGERNEAAIGKINEAAETCAAAGVEIYYHNHAFEFQGERGRRFIDLLHRRLDKRVRMEIDVFWASVGREDPAKMIARWKGRVRSLHLKDRAADAPAETKDETAMPPSAFREAGAGVLDFRSILRAGRRAGVEHYFIEQDATPGDPLDSVRRSYDYLRGLTL